MCKHKLLANLDSMEQEAVRARHKTLEQFWQWKARGKLPTVRKGGPCEWCEKFKPLNFRVCMNCGAKFFNV